MDNLLPCPHCGEPVLLDFDGAWEIYCTCGCSIRFGGDQQVAIKKWNRRHQPSAPAWIADQIPLTAIHNAIRSLERDHARCVEWRDQNAQGSASFAFHNQAVAQCNADITALLSLLPPAEQ